MEPKKVLSYGYYKNLEFEKFEHWNADDLSQFLVWDFHNAFGNTKLFKGLPASFIQDSEISQKKHDILGNAIAFLDELVISFMSLVKRPKRKILFQNSKYRHLIFGMRQHYHIGLMVQGKRDRLFIRKDFSGHMQISELERLVLSYLREKNVAYLRQLVKACEEKLKRIKPDYIILGSDVFPVERAIILAAKNLGIKTLAIQHGIYDVSVPLIDFGAVDYGLVWGKHFKDLYVSHNIREEKDIMILGYPHFLKKNRGVSKNDSVLTVCYLGQDFEKFSGDLLNIKLETVSQLFRVCKKLGLNFIYRPHPGDDVALLKKKLPGVIFCNKKEKLSRTFEKVDILVSFSSTALVQAAMESKISLQLMNYPLKSDNFETMGVCHKSFGRLEALEDYLKNMAHGYGSSLPVFNFNNHYIETSLNPVHVLLKMLEKIEGNRKNMPKVGITHPCLEAGGGSESSTVWMAEALKNNYNVSLISTGIIDLKSLNEAYGTHITDKEVDIITVPPPVFFKQKFSAFRNRFPRFCKSIASDFDLMISGYNPMDFGRKGIQIIADLNFNWRLSQKYNRSREFEKFIYRDSFLRKCYLRVAEIISPSPKKWEINTNISLSKWLADKMQEEFGLKSAVIYPPVPGHFPDVPFEARKNGFVVLCRISPEKEIEKVISIIGRARKLGADITLHIVGKIYDSQLEYADFIKKLCAQNKEWCFFEGAMYGQKKMEYIVSRKYGISGRTNEPWGITIAEMAKAGCVVFVPSGGGQVEIINHPALVFNDETEAAQKIYNIVGNENLQNVLRQYALKQGQQFSIERFKEEIKKFVDVFFEQNKSYEKR